MERKSATDPLGWGTKPSDMIHAIVVRQRVHSDAIEAGHRAPPHFAGVNQLPAGRCALAPDFDHFSFVAQVAAPRWLVLLEARATARSAQRAAGPLGGRGIEPPWPRH